MKFLEKIIGFFQKAKPSIEVTSKNNEELLRKQEILTSEILFDVCRALDSNMVYNKTKDGKVFTEIKRPRATMFPNGGQHTIVIQRPEDMHLNGSGIVYQIDIYLQNEASGLHLHEGPYGADINMPVSEIKDFRKMIFNKVQNCSKFPQ